MAVSAHSAVSPHGSSAQSAEDADLVRGLGPWQATAVVVSTIIGTGVFLVAGPMARVAGSVDLVFIAWLAGTVIALSGMLCFAELGAALPHTGGLFAYLTRGLGPLWGFLFGWADSFLMGPAALATLAAGFMEFAGFLFPGLNAPWLTVHAGHLAFTLAVAQPLAAALVLGLMALNCLSVNVGGSIQLVLSSLKVAAIVLIILAGVLLAKPMGGTVDHGLSPPHGGGFAALLSAIVPVMWAYNGFQYLGNLGAEIRQPGKNIPRALFFGMAIVGVLYVLINVIYFHVLTFGQVALADDVASDVVQSLLGPSGATWLTIAMGISALATLHAVIMEEARVPYAMARTGLFFKWVGMIEPRVHSPIGALIFQGTLGALIALTGTFEQLLSLYVFVMWIFIALGTFTVIRLRRTEPELPRPYRAWGYPWTPLVFIVATVALTANLWIEQPVRSSLGVLVILVGVPFYFYKSAAGQPATP
jgi:basic amino acid/polyamine antiporter, APA family